MAFSLAENYIMVNYHYVEDPRHEWRGIHPCAVADFARQIAWLGTHFSFVSVPDLVHAAQIGMSGKFCALTFDDGLQSQFTHAAPVLRKHRATATFFIITATWEGWLPLAHKIHTVLSKISITDAADYFNHFALPRGLPAIPQDRRINALRKYDDVLTANFKEIMTLISEHDAQEFLDDIMRRHRIHTESVSRELFMDEGQVRHLAREGFAVENHTHRHASFKNMTEISLRNDLRTAQTRLKSVLGSSATVLAYPYGQRGSVQSEALAAEGFRFGVSVEPRSVGASEDPFALPRFNTNDIRSFLSARA